MAGFLKAERLDLNYGNPIITSSRCAVFTALTMLLILLANFFFAAAFGTTGSSTGAFSLDSEKATFSTG